MPPVTVRGTAQVVWKPNYTLLLTSPDGVELDADGELHPLLARLTRTADGVAVPNRTIRILTSPVGKVGHRIRKRTDINGEAVFSVSDTLNEVVTYTADLPPGGTLGSTPLEITWGDSGIGAGVTRTPSDGFAVAGVTLATVQLFAGSGSPDYLTPVQGVIMTLGAVGDQVSPVGDGHVFAATDAAGLTDVFSFTETVPGLTEYSCSAVDPAFTLVGTGHGTILWS